MTRDDVKKQVFEIVALQLGRCEADLEERNRFKEDLNADSLDSVEMVIEIEDFFDIKIPDETAEILLTVGSTIDFVCKKLEIRED
ncbi:MAG: acyl carrier protein [Patescibacteria group bacterium]